MSLGPLYVLLGELFVQVLCLFFKWIVFLGPLHQRWSSFIMHRCVLGGYLLQTKERVSLNTSKEDICNVKAEVAKTGYAPYLEGLAQILGR